MRGAHSFSCSRLVLLRFSCLAECSVPMVDVPGFDCLGSAIQKSQPWDVTTLGMGNGIMHNSGLVPTVFPSAPAFPSTWPFHQSMPSPVFGSGSLASPGWLKFQGSEPYAAGAFQGMLLFLRNFWAQAYVRAFE